MSKKILFINEHLYAGGVERSLVDVLRHLDYSKYEVDLLLLEGAGDYINEIPSEVNLILNDIRLAYGPLKQVIYNNFKKKNWFGIKYRLSLLFSRIIGDTAYKIVIRLLGINKSYDTAIAYRIGPSADIIAHGVKAKQKICWWHHGAICEDHDTKSWLQVWAHFDRLVAVSNGVRDILANLSNNLIPKLRVIPNMVDVEQICTMGAAGKSPYQNDNCLKFITVGRIVVEKHIENVVNAAVRLRADGRLNFKWYIIGDGDLYNQIEALICENNIADQVILCGRKANPYPYIKHADMMVHTSHIESQGLVIQEAMALGTPCIVTRSVGPSEFIIDSENGIMVEPNVDSLIEGIYKLAENKDLQKKVADNGIKSIDRYTPHAIIEQFENLLNYD